jgi:hypothetical protein
MKKPKEIGIPVPHLSGNLHHAELGIIAEQLLDLYINKESR